MSNFNKLSRAEMKMVIGGNVDKNCQGIVTCADGTRFDGIFDCTDLSDGGDGDVVCNAGGHGDSTSCDCRG